MITKSVVVRLAVAAVVFLTAGVAIARGVVSPSDTQRALSSTASSSQESSAARFPSKALVLTHQVKTHRAEMEATKPVGAKFVVATAAHSSPPSSASAFIEQPAAGSTVSGPVRLLFGVRGRCIGSPATGCDHLHVYVDGSSQYFALYSTSTSLSLAPGPHAIRAVVALPNHDSTGIEVSVTFRVS